MPRPSFRTRRSQPASPQSTWSPPISDTDKLGIEQIDSMVNESRSCSPPEPRDIPSCRLGGRQ
eukprot:1139813-Prorocentrum_lima.AAC.1